MPEDAPPKSGGLTKAFGKVSTFVKIVDMLDTLSDWATEAIKDGKVKVAFEFNKADLVEYAAVVDALIDNSGEEGALIGMYCIKGELLSLPQLYPGPVIVGLGQDPQDAMDKYYLSETKIEEPFPGVKLFGEGEGYKAPSIGDECFGLWVEKGEGPGARKISLIDDMLELNTKSNINWITHKSNLLLKKNVNEIVALKNTHIRYEEMLNKYQKAAVEKGVFGSIANLIQANAQAHEKFLQAANDVNKALERQKKYRIYSELGALLGVASSVVALSDSLSAKAQTSSDYFKNVYYETKSLVEKNQNNINMLFIETFQIEKDALPNPDVPDLILP